MPAQTVKKQTSMVEASDHRGGGGGGGGGGRTPKEKSAFPFKLDVFKTKSKEKVRKIFCVRYNLSIFRSLGFSC